MQFNKKITTRIVALLLAFMMGVTTVPDLVYASEPEVDAAEVVMQEELDTADEATEEEIVGEEAETVEDEEEIVEDEEEIVEDEEEIVEDTVNYIVIDNPMLIAGATEKIAISVGEEAISNAMLTVKNMDTGTNVSVSAVNYVDNSALFEFSYSQLSKGKYQISSLSYYVGDIQKTKDFSNETYYFGVDVDVDTSPDDYLVEDSATIENAQVVVTDKNGNVLSDGGFDKAIDEAGIGGLKGKDANGNIVVVIDPGHDNMHGGTNGHAQKEANLTLKIALAAAEELRQYKGVQVYLTHDTLACPNGGGVNGNCLVRRTQIALEKNADLFVSLHLNATVGGNSGTAHGVEIYYPNENFRPELSPIGKDAATQIINQLVALGLSNRGVKIRSTVNDTYPDGSKQDYYAVIRESKLRGIPGIIVEHAFLDNPGDYAAYLNNDEKLKALGVADARGIATYFRLSKGSAYEAVFDAEYYWNKYPDLQKAFAKPLSKGDTALLNHFLNHGMNERRQGCAGFNVDYYRNRYKDLRAAFGSNWKSYYLHYVTNGEKEGRDAATPCELTEGITTLNGVNYSRVYDYQYYIKNHPDVKRVYGVDDVAVLQHFIDFGMKEGRRASESFDVKSYYYQYVDLRQAFGKDWKSYYLHYMNFGYKEGRSGTGTTSLQGGVTVYNGINYSAVYNFDYYKNKYADLKAAFGNDDIKMLEHFVNFGMAEKRQAIESFNVNGYFNRYPDLRRTFGTNWKLYYLHYMNNGIKEGRTAPANAAYVPDTVGYPIMGNSACTVSQMAAMYRSKNSIFNVALYGMTLEQFCQLYLEEAAMEGVRGEVAFCQMLHETNWLKYTGDVRPGQFNFAGIGATGGGNPGNSFSSPREGIRAQVQHLKAYASVEPLKNPCVDPRFNLVKPRGIASTLPGLSQRWAAGTAYGEKITAYINQMLAMK